MTYCSTDDSLGLRTYIREMVLNHLDPPVSMPESRLRECIARAAIDGYVSQQLWEAAKRGKSARRKTTAASEVGRQRRSVMRMLQNDALNHAELMRRIWNPKPSEEDSKRSLFSKMATGTPDADGVVHKFSNRDIVKLYNILRNINK